MQIVQTVLTKKSPRSQNTDIEYCMLPIITKPIIKRILLHGRILRGFPFWNDIMPAQSAAVDPYRISLPPRHRADSA